MGHNEFLAAVRISTTNLLQYPISFLLLRDISGLQYKQKDINYSLLASY